MASQEEQSRKWILTKLPSPCRLNKPPEQEESNALTYFMLLGAGGCLVHISIPSAWHTVDTQV